jgi:hypothetical protein
MKTNYATVPLKFDRANRGRELWGEAFKLLPGRYVIEAKPPGYFTVKYNTPPFRPVQMEADGSWVVPVGAGEFVIHFQEGMDVSTLTILQADKQTPTPLHTWSTLGGGTDGAQLKLDPGEYRVETGMTVSFRRLLSKAADGTETWSATDEQLGPEGEFSVAGEPQTIRFHYHTGKGAMSLYRA